MFAIRCLDGRMVGRLDCLFCSSSSPVLSMCDLEKFEMHLVSVYRLLVMRGVCERMLALIRLIEPCVIFWTCTK